MRLLPAKHTLGVLRRKIGPDMTQSKMARLVGRSPISIKKIELNQLPLGAVLGSEIAIRTGVNLEWLLKNDVRAPIIDADGKPYTRETFERVQVGSEPDSDSCSLPKMIELFLTKIALAGLAARRSNQPKAVELFAYRMGESIDAVAAKVEGYQNLMSRWEAIENQVRTGPWKSGMAPTLEQLLKDYPETVNHIKSTSRALDRLSGEMSKDEALENPEELRDFASVIDFLRRYESKLSLLIVTGHMAIERRMETKLSWLLVAGHFPEEIVLEHSTFREKLQLLIILIHQRKRKFDTRFFSAIKAIDGLRNKLCHRSFDELALERDLEAFLTEYYRWSSNPGLLAASPAERLRACILELCRMLGDSPRPSQS